MVNPYGGFYAVRHSGWLPNSSQARWKPTANVPKRNSTTMAVCVYGWISVSRPQKRGESIMCILYWRLFPLGILQNKKIRTRLSSNKRTSKHMTHQALTSGLNTSMYKATRSPPQGIRIPKISTILSASHIKTSHFTTPIRSMISRQHHLVKHGSSRLLNRGIFYFLNFHLTRTLVRCMIMALKEHLFDWRVYDDWMGLLFYIDGRDYAGGSGIPRGGLY